MAGEEEKGYTWETEYEKTWEALREDAEGSLQSTVDEMVLRAKRKKLLERPVNVKLGMMRHLFLILDMSQSMEDQDLRPTRLLSCLKLLEYLIEEYFDQNPISQLGIIVTRNKRSEKVTELGGNPRMHISHLQKLRESKCEGEPSLQNALSLAADTLKHMPGHASREVLVIFGSLMTCDPGDINDTIQLLKRYSIQCSMIGLAAEVRICRKLCQDTKGKYDVILDEPHFKDLLLQHVSPPPASSNTESSLIKMGFPHQMSDVSQGPHVRPSMCMCHTDSQSDRGLSSAGYFCPQCRSKYCELPVECRVCGLTLVSAPHLARSYHHLFPLETFSEVTVDVALPFQKDRFCFACQKSFKGDHVYQCGRCLKPFCVDCDLFVHETLHSCPGCASSRHTQLLLA